MTTTSWIGGLLDFDRDGDVFIAPQWSGPGARLFGGLIAAQSLGAAGATVDPDKRPQSLHAYFVRGGQHGVDVELQVERTRDGRSFDTRRVTARQQGKVILEMIASFHLDEPGADWFPPRAPSIELVDAIAKDPDLDVVDRFELRCNPDDDSPFAVPPFWIRTRDRIEDDPLIRACTLTYMSDLGPVPAARPPGTPVGDDVGYAASLDHSVWFHRPFRPDAWHRYEVDSLGNSHSRGLVVGGLYDEAGSLIANTSQQALWRLGGAVSNDARTDLTGESTVNKDLDVLRIDEGEQIANVQDRLMKRFTDVPAEQVSATVAQAHKHFITSTVRDYVALLVERRAHAELQASLHRRG